MKYLVYAFYPNLGIKVRTVDFKSKREMLDYVSGLRMTDTPYAVQDVSNKDYPVLLEFESFNLSHDEIVQMLKDWIGRKEE